jgi:molecular chaperone GrpE (heat shock protein)
LSRSHFSTTAGANATTNTTNNATTNTTTDQTTTATPPPPPPPVDPDIDADQAPEVPEPNTNKTVAYEEFEKVQQQLAQTQQERDQFKDELLRALAEMENTRKIAKRDVENAREYGIEAFAKSLLPVNDNFTRALQSISAEELERDTEHHHLLRTLHEGVSMTQELFTKALKKHGVEEFHPLGEKFDPNRHDALFMVCCERARARVTERQSESARVHWRYSPVSPCCVVMSLIIIVANVTCSIDSTQWRCRSTIDWTSCINRLPVAFACIACCQGWRCLQVTTGMTSPRHTQHLPHSSP